MKPPDAIAVAPMANWRRSSKDRNGGLFQFSPTNLQATGMSGWVSQSGQGLCNRSIGPWQGFLSGVVSSNCDSQVQSNHNQGILPERIGRDLWSDFVFFIMRPKSKRMAGAWSTNRHAMVTPGVRDHLDPMSHGLEKEGCLVSRAEHE